MSANLDSRPVPPPLLVVYAPGSPTPATLIRSLSGVADACFVILAEHAPATLDAFPPAATIVVGAGEPERAAAWAAGRGVRGVVTYSELALRFTAQVARTLGLPHHDVRAAETMTDKLAQRRALAAAGVPVPAFAEIRGPGDVDGAAAAVGFPAVLKPRRGMGSALVERVTGLERLRAVVAASWAGFDADERLRGTDPAFVLEQQLRGVRWHEDPRFGDYVSVESLLDRGRIVHLAITDKTPLAEPFREVGHLMPSSLPDGRLAQIHEAATAALRAVGAYHGATHTEIKLTADGPRVIEVNGRLGGAMARLMRNAAGFDVIAVIAANALGRDDAGPPRFTRYALTYWPPPPAGIVDVTAVGGLDDIVALPGVEHLALMNPAGSTIDSRGGTSTVAIVRAVGESPADLLDLRDQIDALLRVEYRYRQEPA
ncbi:ATP-grasp domain-containing protein [Dactylosporangium cerinum]|uniref:ATP-grasp domain-containing protein n=1 Tax=Dactylosporangium cerinum TaxID=1434730 RepID=A0ABV9WJP0_9ACTN